MQCLKLTRKFPFHFVHCRMLSKKIPDIDLQIIEQLERLSLVEFNNEQGYISLQKSVQSADLLQAVDTTNVEPLASVLEDRALWLREDKVTEGNQLKEILSNATKVEENYFVAPPGNIPMKKRDKDFLKSVLENKHSK
ncbi:glutamyl-tRNA(Gln) amidotransferase subunit C, mitochondrial-like isoform X2 [Biomphalaria glabrata]|nr:glutamyl-tRNA(Gln) amidotransferase subunit C, mitochondrial-like isoform X2 [Biomphalaria glabrata]XP_055862040.1 glutamyl-tRNA(Gln) amidotransferase subunit C, mitochondrial-like isoform X2 [Biomphalaria glabrata]XP_055862041.1 glutamyl-tRNA(Gln) amidotransferase subunit C, mitochondrial-like isoform X2 [Biomphalaria glabrata]XP_055862042.1 glutamyl-tRNA(Gln) amidotransferase subunit C, mitochondrial-like isoform X2 [Biomphalaria glabrata]